MRSKENKNRFIEVGILANEMKSVHAEGRVAKNEVQKEKEIYRALRRIR